MNYNKLCVEIIFFNTLHHLHSLFDYVVLNMKYKQTKKKKTQPNKQKIFTKTQQRYIKKS